MGETKSCKIDRIDLNKLQYIQPSDDLISNAISSAIKHHRDEIDSRLIYAKAQGVFVADKRFSLGIKKVIFNNPATIVLWEDGEKTIVKCGENDVFDPEKGLALCFVKRVFGNKGNYYNNIKKWLPEESEEEKAAFATLTEAVQRLAAAFKRSGLGWQGVDAAAEKIEKKQVQPPLFTRDAAVILADIFEEILYKYDIYVPSEDDDDRADGDVGLYGSEYSDLLDKIENFLRDLFSFYAPDVKVITGVYSGEKKAVENDDLYRNQQYISAVNAAKKLGVTPSTVRRWFHEGRLKGKKVSKYVWIEADDPAFEK